MTRTISRLLCFALLVIAPAIQAAPDIVERGLVVCDQAPNSIPTAHLASVQSSELLVPVGAPFETNGDLPAEDLPPLEGLPCTEVLSDLTREGYSIVASTPILSRRVGPQENFLVRRPPTTELLEWTIELPESIALLLCDPLQDVVLRFTDSNTPSEFFVPTGANCTAHLAALLVQGGRVLTRTASMESGTVPPSGPVSVYTAYELMRMFPEEESPRLLRFENGRTRLP